MSATSAGERRTFTGRNGMRHIVRNALLKFLLFTLIPERDRAVISRNAAVDLHLGAALRAKILSSRQTSVVLAHRKRRGNRNVRNAEIFDDLTHQRTAGLRIRQLFAQKDMENRSAGVLGLQTFLLF